MEHSFMILPAHVSVKFNKAKIEASQGKLMCVQRLPSSGPFLYRTLLVFTEYMRKININNK